FLGFIPRWNIFQGQIVAFFIYLMSAYAETNRVPFDLPEAETELVAGYHTEYSAMKFAMFFMAEYVNMITVACLATLLFLGGWHGPIFGTVCVAGAVNLLAQRHPINSALSLVVVMGSLAGEYLLLGAEFVAAVQVIVYAGAIMVLFVFVIMLLNAGEEERTRGSRIA